MTKSRKIPNDRTLKASDIFLVILVIFLGLIGGKLLLHWQEHRALQDEITHLDTFILQVPTKEVIKASPQLSDLLTIIDECVVIFRDEDIAIQSYNLERIREEGDIQTALKSGLIRFKVLGSWEGIERGLSHMENMLNQAIHVEEASLDKNGGEILLKIFFFDT